MASADELIERACEEAALDDFGGMSYREGLEVLVASLAGEAALSEVGVAALEAQVTTNLVNRLRVTDWLATHPELLRRPVERPLFVLGMPRTGTTLLSYLLDEDPANRSLLRWEALASVPPPTTASLRTDPRVDAAREGQAMLDVLNPEFKAIHYEAADGPTECVAVFAQDFKSLLWETVANVPTYAAWLAGTDLTSAYAYHERELQVLQSAAPGRWTLKSPAHCFGLDALVARYPDARLVMTHRDPVAVVASVCSLVRSLSGTFSDADHSEYIAAHWTDVVADAVDRVADFRRREGDDRFVDVRYDDLIADPIGEVRRIYKHAGDELGDDAARRMAAYVDANPQGVHGRHRYTLEDLGLDRATLEERFADYRATFAV
jgi:hypothetical protein